MSYKIFNFVKFSRNCISPTPAVFSVSMSSEASRKYNKENEKVPTKEEKWRKAFEEVTRKPLLPINPESPIFRFFQQDIEMNPTSINNYFSKNIKKVRKEMQSFVSSRHKILGSNLGAAYFLIYMGGKVKFMGHEKWIDLNKDKKTVNLPSRFDPNYILEEIDASDILLYYEGLENFRGVSKIKKAIFARSPLFDDWAVDRIAYLFPLLEYLDISDCPKVSERAMEALYKLPYLKTLIITNHNKSAAFELTAMMLEDCNPKLRIQILNPREINK